MNGVLLVEYFVFLSWLNLNIKSKFTTESFWHSGASLWLFLSFPFFSMGGCRMYDFDVVLGSVIPKYLPRVSYLPYGYNIEFLLIY